MSTEKLFFVIFSLFLKACFDDHPLNIYEVFDWRWRRRVQLMIRRPEKHLWKLENDPKSWFFRPLFPRPIALSFLKNHSDNGGEIWIQRTNNPLQTYFYLQWKMHLFQSLFRTITRRCSLRPRSFTPGKSTISMFLSFFVRWIKMCLVLFGQQTRQTKFFFCV